MIALLLAGTGCSQLSALFGKKTADTAQEDPIIEDDTDQTTDEPDVQDDVQDIVDVHDVKLDVHDVKGKDAKEVDTGPDEQDEPTDEDIQDDIDDATDLTDAADDVDAGVDADDTDTDAQDAEVEVDAGISCKVDADCGVVAASSCAPKFLCLVEPGAASGLCMASGAAPDGSLCDDGKKCTVNDACTAGTCKGTPKDCEDGNPCTLNSCVEALTANGGCKSESNIPGTPCDADGDPCTVGDKCSGVACIPGTVNVCACQVDADCAVQDSANLCLGKHICTNNLCVLDPTTVTPPCTNLNLQCQVNTCDPTTGKCAPANRPNTIHCTDGDVCTFPDLCTDGVCASTPVVCNDGNDCTDDACVSTNSKGCTFTANTVPCDDHNPCTMGGVCAGGSCTTGALNPTACGCVVDADCASFNSNCLGTYHCSSSNTCVVDPATIVKCSTLGNGTCRTNTCNPDTGQCDYVFTAAGTTCNDGNVCTTGDHCDGYGKCAKTSMTVCDDANVCTTDYCDSAVGCMHPFNGAKCDDNDSCTPVDKCTLGKCVGNAIDPSTNKPYCNCALDSDCVSFNTNKCQAPHVCATQTHTCIFSGTPPVDPCASEVKLPCHTYACDPAKGTCAKPNMPNGTVCSDGNWCTSNDTCSAGVCSGPTNKCDDGNDCTTDNACDPKLGTDGCSVHTPVDDGTACKLSDVCQLTPQCTGGVCGGTPKVCDDGNPCTLDSCDPKTGCKSGPVINGTACTDNNPCTGEDTKVPADGSTNVGQDSCIFGKCVSGKPKDCKVPNVGGCYTGTCDPTSTTVDPLTQKYACVQKTNTNPCQGGDMCVISQTCADGVCQGGVAKNCDDGNTCTADSCWSSNIDPLTQPGTCIHSALGAYLCDDGNPCTNNDVCVSSTCAGKLIPYDDGNPCTLDGCDPKTGPTHTNDPNGNCGPLAKCNNDLVPACVFSSKPILISELYLGVANDPSDDWIEIHNPTANDVAIPSYAIEVAEANPAPGVGWTTLTDTGTAGAISAHGYLLLAHSATVIGGNAADVVAPTLDFKHAAQVDTNGVPITVANQPVTITVGQLRLRDTVNGLVHDRLCLDAGGCTDMGVDVTPVSLGSASASSLERRAAATSTADSMAYHHKEWLAGNDYTGGAMPNDNYVIRLTADPQTHLSGVYEPACGGNCPELPLQTCNYTPAAEACVADTKCAIGCGSGKTCAEQMCNVNVPGLLFSEILPGAASNSNAQFIELYNAASQAIDMSGYVVQFKSASAACGDPWTVLFQVPAAVTLPPHRYFAIGTAAYAATSGGVDALVWGSLGLDPAGSALRLWDPRTDSEIDTVGWGSALSFSNCTNASYKVGTAVTPGDSLERRSAQFDYAADLKPGGGHCLAGNGQDTGSDDKDWIDQDVPGAQSKASGQFEPACGGTCAFGSVCPFTGTTGGTCADPTCGGSCNTQGSTSGGGYSCDVALATPACDATGLVFAEISPQGANSTTPGGGSLNSAANEYIVLYNRSNQDIVLDNLYIKFRYTTVGTLLNATDSDVNKKPLTGIVHAHSYFLIAPSTYDGKLPGPDFVAGLTWGLYPDTGTLRLLRYDAAGQATVLDRVSWGPDPFMWAYGEGSGAPGCPDNTQPCAIKRLPAPGLMADDVISLLSPWYYAGAGWDTNSNKDNFVSTETLTPRNHCLQSTGSCPANSPGVPQKP